MLLTMSTALSMVVAALAWRCCCDTAAALGVCSVRWSGSCVGCAAAGLSFAAAAADKHVGPHFGGSLLGD